MSTTTCRACGAEIYWKLSRNGRWTPVNPDGETHWATCSHAPQLRRALRRGFRRRTAGPPPGQLEMEGLK